MHLLNTWNVAAIVPKRDLPEDYDRLRSLEPPSSQAACFPLSWSFELEIMKSPCHSNWKFAFNSINSPVDELPPNKSPSESPSSLNND